ncbi:MAG: hypothetical protein WAO15_16485 [Mycobacterium sp.]
MTGVMSVLPGQSAPQQLCDLRAGSRRSQRTLNSLLDYFLGKDSKLRQNYRAAIGR